MTDIVERLREYTENIRGKDEPPENYMAWQAADEIEALRKQLVSDINAEDEIARLEAEIEALRHVNEELSEDVQTLREFDEVQRKALDDEKKWNRTLEITARKDVEQAADVALEEVAALIHDRAVHIRNVALEEAAKLAEGYEPDLICPRGVAAAIRELKDQ